MIRSSSESDLKRLTEIWLSASILAHSFIDEKYWLGQVDNMKNKYLPSSNIFVYTDKYDEIKGFVSIINHNIEAIFIDPHDQGKGIGQQLISFLKKQYDTLTLTVYKK